MKEITTTGIALDIDNTLAATNFYWASSLHERFGHSELSPREIVDRYHTIDFVPEWQGAEPLAWMHEARNSHELHKELPLIDNVQHMVNRMQNFVPIAAYITGRPETLREATQHWLTKHDFPEAPLYMRPSSIEHKGWGKWKAEYVASLYPAVAGIVDDDVRFVGELPPEYQGVIFLYGQEQCPRTDIRVVCSKTWEDVLAAVEAEYGHV